MATPEKILEETEGQKSILNTYTITSLKTTTTNLRGSTVSYNALISKCKGGKKKQEICMYGFPAHWYFSSCNLKLVGHYKASGRMTEQTGSMICRPASKPYDPACPPYSGLELSDVRPVKGACIPPSLSIPPAFAANTLASRTNRAQLYLKCSQIWLLAGCRSLSHAKTEQVLSAHTADPHVPLSVAAQQRDGGMQPDVYL